MRGLRSRVLWDLRATMPFLPGTSDSGYYGRTCPVTGKFAYPQRAENRKEEHPRKCLPGPTCHPEQPRGIYSPALVAAHEVRRLDPSLPLGMTTAARGRSPLFRLVAARPACK